MISSFFMLFFMIYLKKEGVKMGVYKKNKKFKNVDKTPSLLGFGCMRFPLICGSEEIDKDLVFKMIDYAYQNGVTYFDTAYPYHNGKSEIVIGEALKKYERESFYLADKMPTWLLNSVDDAKKIFAEQLEKCSVDYFDFYLCHALNNDNYLKYRDLKVMDFLLEMKKEGKIKRLGCSFHDTPEVLEKILNTYDFDFVQIQLNYLDWDYQKASEQYEIIRKRNLPIIVMEPVRGGTLANLGEDVNQIFKAVNNNASVASWALRFAASCEQVMTVLSGMSNFEQVKDNINTFSNYKPLDDLERKTIDEALSLFLKNKIIPCTGCRYCMDCPFGVDIPKNFKIYNNFAISGRKEGFINNFEALMEHNAIHCKACKACVKKCPQHIDIPTKMKMINDVINEIRS